MLCLPSQFQPPENPPHPGRFHGNATSGSQKDRGILALLVEGQRAKAPRVNQGERPCHGKARDGGTQERTPAEPVWRSQDPDPRRLGRTVAEDPQGGS